VPPVSAGEPAAGPDFGEGVPPRASVAPAAGDSSGTSLTERVGASGLDPDPAAAAGDPDEEGVGAAGAAVPSSCGSFGVLTG
jgi:hypothetical protein